MIEAHVNNGWKALETLFIVLPICILAAWGVYLLYMDSRSERTVRFGPSGLLPWSLASKARRKRLELEITETETDLFDARTKRLQAESLHRDIETQTWARELESGESTDKDGVVR